MGEAAALSHPKVPDLHPKDAGWDQILGTQVWPSCIPAPELGQFQSFTSEAEEGSVLP